MVQRSLSRRLVTLSATVAAALWALTATPVLASGGHHTPDTTAAAAPHNQHDHDTSRDDDRPDAFRDRHPGHSAGDTKDGHDDTGGGRTKDSGGTPKASVGGTATSTAGTVAGGTGALSTGTTVVTLPPSTTQTQPSGGNGATAVTPAALVQPVTPSGVATPSLDSRGVQAESTNPLSNLLSLAGLSAMAPLGGILNRGLNLTSLLLMVNLLVALGIAAVLRFRWRGVEVDPA